MPDQTLNLVILIGDDGIRAWEAECLAILRDIPQVRLAGIVRETGDAPSPVKRLIKTARRRLLLPRCMRPVAPPDWLPTIPSRDVTAIRRGWRERFPEPDVQWIREMNPDIVLRFGFGILSGAILEVARLGLWSFHHGDLERVRGRPPAFWELLRGETRTGVTLQRLTEKLDGGFIIDRSWVPVVPWSLKRTLSRCYAETAPLLRKSINRCLANGYSEHKPARLGKLYKNPGPFQAAALLLKCAKAFASWSYEKSLLTYRWRIGLADVPKTLFNGDTKITPQWLFVNDRGFFADPCVLGGSEHSVLVEHWKPGTLRGEIRRLDFSAGPEQPKLVDVLAESFHLSFPRAYRDSSVWLVPEMADAGRQLAYPMDANAENVTGEGRVIDGLENVVDPVLFEQGDSWWALASPSGHQSGYHLNLYHSDKFFGPYLPHPENPVVVDPFGARPAGPVVQRDGRLFRFGQIYGKRYGEGVDVFEITTLDKRMYRERRVGRIRRGDGPPGLHTVDFKGEQLVVDGYRMQFNLLAGVQRVLMKLRSA